MLCAALAFDADGNGTISTEELRTVIEYLIEKVDQDEVEGIIKQIDRDGTGEIDYQGNAIHLHLVRCGGATHEKVLN